MKTLKQVGAWTLFIAGFILAMPFILIADAWRLYRERHPGKEPPKVDMR